MGILSDMRRGLGIVMLFCAVAVLLTAPGAAWGIPTYDGTMQFPSIHDPFDPEEFSWEVTLGNNQELQQVGERRAEVVYVGTDVIAFEITATAAHDAVGVDVPTSLLVSEGDIITLTVHHRAGNPATGAAFDYPIIAGEGWESGFETVVVQLPSPESKGDISYGSSGDEAEEGSRNCVVPRLVGRSLGSARKRLRKAGCRLGRIRGARSRDAKVVRQSPGAQAVIAWNQAVSVTLATRTNRTGHSASA